MKVDFYVDVYRDQTRFFPNPWPPSDNPAGNGKRVKFTVDIPMDTLFPVDIDLGEVRAEEVQP